MAGPDEVRSAQSPSGLPEVDWWRNAILDSLDCSGDLRPNVLALIARMPQRRGRWALRVFSRQTRPDTWWSRYLFRVQAVVVLMSMYRWLLNNAFGNPSDSLAMSNLQNRLYAGGGGETPPQGILMASWTLNTLGHYEKARELLSRLLAPGGTPGYLRWVVLPSIASIPCRMAFQNDLVAAFAFQNWLHGQMKQHSNALRLHALHELAGLCVQMGQRDAGLAYYKEEVRERAGLQGPHHADVLRAHASMAELLREMGKLDDAKAHGEFVVQSMQRRWSRRDDKSRLIARAQLLLTRIRSGEVDDSTDIELDQLHEELKTARFDTFTNEATNLDPLFLERDTWRVRRGQQQPSFVLVDRILRKPYFVSGNPDLILALLSSSAAMRDLGEVAQAQDIELRLLETLSVPARRLINYVHRGPILSSRFGRFVLKYLPDYETILSSRLGVEIIRGELSVWRRLQFGEQIISRWLLDPELFVTLTRVMPSIRKVTQAGLDELELERQGDRGWLGERFRAFHEAWLALCERNWPEEVMSAIGPLHGMESWIFCIGPGLPSDKDELPEARRAYVTARRQMTAAKLGTGVGPIAAALNSFGLGDPATANEAFRAARGMLAAEDRAFAAAEWLTATSLVRLGDVAGTRSLVLMNAVGNRLLAHCIQTGHALRSVELGELDQVLVKMAYSAGCHRELQIGQLRDVIGATRLVPTDLKPSLVEAQAVLSDMQQRIAETVWAPLKGILRDTASFDLVTGPGLHALPFTLGLPDGWEMHHFCGLPAYIRLRGTPALDCLDRDPLPVRPRSGVSVFIDDAHDAINDEAQGTAAPIPFVKVEAVIARNIFAGAKGEDQPHSILPARNLNDSGGQYRPCLHIATHGMVLETSRSDAGSRHGGLCIDAAKKTSFDGAAAINLPGDIREVFVSSCVAGMVGSDKTGDPLGVVSSLQLKGVETVIACLAPVADFWMPLLAGAYWDSRFGGFHPAAALRSAKQQLINRNWSEGFVQIASEAYREGMHTVLGEIRNETEHCSRRLRLFLSLAGWPLSADIRTRWLGAATPIEQEANFHNFLDAWLLDEAGQARLINDVIERIFGESERPWSPEELNAIAQVNAFTVCFGIG